MAMSSPPALSAMLCPSKISSSLAPTRFTCTSGTRSSRETSRNMARRVFSLPKYQGEADKLMNHICAGRD